MSKIRVAVLMGGTSAEREVSLSTGRQILNALDPARYSVYALDTASGQTFLPSGISNPIGRLTTADGTTEIQALTQLPQVAPDSRPAPATIVTLSGTAAAWAPVISKRWVWNPGLDTVMR